jgi:hypothetical protein
VWVEEEPGAGESGDGGSAGYGGDYGGGGYGGDFGGYGGDYGGGAYGGTYGGGAYGGTYPGVGGTGAYGGVTTGGFAGSYGGVYPTGGINTGGAIPTGGVTTGGFAGSFAGKGGTGGSAGVAGKGGCGAASGAGGSSGSPALGKACATFCPRYPYASCGGVSDFEGPRDCLGKCQNGFGLSSWCEYALVDFLNCAASYLNPNAMCIVSNGQCYGPGCVVDAVNACAFQYVTLLECQDTPRPIPPCPPPPNRPLPPGCSLSAGQGPGDCQRETSCPMGNFLTECERDSSTSRDWYCNCYRNGVYEQSVQTLTSTDTCATAAQLCGYY